MNQYLSREPVAVSRHGYPSRPPHPAIIHGRTIICIASSWAADRTSKHHVMDVLSKHNTVLWVNYHGSRKPRANLADARSATSTAIRILRGPQRIGDSMLQFTPAVLPGAHSGILAVASKNAVIAQIRRALRRIQSREPRPVQVWTFAPDVPFLAGKLNEERFVYYCADEYSKFEGYDTRAIERAERELMRHADVVLTTSEPLREAKAKHHPNVHLVRHGVDVEHFASALQPRIHIPSDVRDLERPVVGFFGMIHHWIDVELIVSVARKLPDMKFALIGPVLTDVSELRSLENVHLLGRKPYDDLPAYCAAFDLAIVPFRRNELTRNVNPIKLREYLAAGLPVVSTPMPEAEVYPEDVTIASDADTFARACKAAAGRCSREDRVRRAQLVAGAGWDDVVRRICPIVTASRTATDDATSMFSHR